MIGQVLLVLRLLQLTATPGPAREAIDCMKHHCEDRRLQTPAEWRRVQERARNKPLKFEVVYLITENNLLVESDYYCFHI